MERQNNISNRISNVATRFSNLKTRMDNAKVRFDKLAIADWNEFENILSMLEFTASCSEQASTLLEINLTKSGV